MSCPRKDIAWLPKAISRETFDGGRRGACAPDDRGWTDAFIRWTLRQVPEVQGGFVAMDVNTGRVIAMQGGFSYQHSVFNRATQATAPAGVELQAVCLCRSAGQRLFACDHRGGRTD